MKMKKYVVGGVLALAIIISPVFISSLAGLANAQTSNPNQATINQLVQLLQSLVQQLQQLLMIKHQSVQTTKDSLKIILGNLSYGFPDQDQIKLVNGYLSQKVQDCGNKSCTNDYYYTHLRLDEKIAVGDLNSDGINDVAVILLGGGITYKETDEVQYDDSQTIAAVVNQNGSYKNVAFLNPRYDLGAGTISIKNIEIKNNLIYVTLVKNRGTPSSRYLFPDVTETIQLSLNNSSTKGFIIMKDGASDVNSYVAPQITNVSVYESEDKKNLYITGKDFSLFKNYFILTAKTGTQFQEYTILDLGSTQNNSYIVVGLSHTIPTGKYGVVVSSYRCPERQSCLYVKSNSFVIDIP